MSRWKRSFAAAGRRAKRWPSAAWAAKRISLPLEGIPILERDGEYVLFLDDVSGCCVFRPEDSGCCQFQNGDQGVYAVDPEDPERFVSVSGRLRDQEDRIFTIGQLEEKLALVNQETPPDPMREVNELRARLETGLKDREAVSGGV